MLSLLCSNASIEVITSGAAAEFHKWNKADGKVLAGLTRRRASESLLYQGIPDLDYDGKADPEAPEGSDAANCR